MVVLEKLHNQDQSYESTIRRLAFKIGQATVGKFFPPAPLRFEQKKPTSHQNEMWRVRASDMAASEQDRRQPQSYSSPTWGEFHFSADHPGKVQGNPIQERELNTQQSMSEKHVVFPENSSSFPDRPYEVPKNNP